MRDTTTETGWDLDAETDLWREFCTPFRHPEWYFWFVRVAMGIDDYVRANPQDRWFHPKFHRRFCAWLQKHHEEWYEWQRKGILRRKKIAAYLPRFTGKSQLCTKTSPLVIWLMNPNASGQIGSEDLGLAYEFYAPIQEILEGKAEHAWFAALFGVWRHPDRRWENKGLVHAARTNTALTDPSLTIFALTKGVTAKHPDFGWVDDPLSEDGLKESGTHLANTTASMFRLRPAFRPNSFLGVCATRKREADVMGVNIEEEGVRSWEGMPVIDERYEPKPDGEWDIFFWQARDPETGESTLPMWTTKELDTYERTQPANFASEMQNNPGSGDDASLTREQVESLWVDEIPRDAEGKDRKLPVVLCLDTAFKNPDRKNKGDDSVILQWGLDDEGTGDVYFEWAHASKTDEYDDFTDKLIERVKYVRAAGRRVVAITDEKDSHGKEGVWEAYLRNKFRAAGVNDIPRIVLFNRQGKNKRLRIRATHGFWTEGHVRILRGAPNANKFIQQNILIDYTKHDDLADAGADVFTNEIYRPLLDPRLRSERTKMPVRPGDDLLEAGLDPRNLEELRNLYDAARRRELERFTGSETGDEDDAVVDSNATWPF